MIFQWFRYRSFYFDCIYNDVAIKVLIFIAFRMISASFSVKGEENHRKTIHVVWKNNIGCRETIENTQKINRCVHPSIDDVSIYNMFVVNDVILLIFIMISVSKYWLWLYFQWFCYRSFYFDYIYHDFCIIYCERYKKPKENHTFCMNKPYVL